MVQKHIGIRDVAKAAGVSVTTVSHVLNSTPYSRTSEETRRRVRETASRLGYGPNRMAQGLRTQRSGMIGLLSEEIATTPHAGRIILGAQETARAHDLTLVIINSGRDANDENHRADVEALLNRQVDGILYATMYHRELSLPANLVGTPAVLIDASDRAGLVPSVVPDEVGGAISAVAALIEAGHEKIGFLNNIDDVPATRGRLEGYRAVLAAAGLSFDPDLVTSSASETASGYISALSLLRHSQPPTALFCYNDRMAMGAYRAAAELGMTVPADLSIVGFDNQELIAANLYPALTTVALPHYEMGAWAVETLVGLMAGREEYRLLADQPTVLSCPLVVRNSIAPPRGGEHPRSKD
ncbi:LacI family DNA-binding transcriptional regulator [Subtercola boreus]|uniref:LacI family transcriptional regulator n=1 Tax=Subtercola boreus TaxID=120213 RepID=A0A3E0W8K8_9MICO|nr:LacI family DNA-binding transcriptional regulator [Subtercola boreus]RFA17853.1 LacI family transcriptional regulator [Subtercola boreus]RFA24572.1 LacI family transcriptional regulator [Subtercola boreus]